MSGSLLKGQFSRLFEKEGDKPGRSKTIQGGGKEHVKLLRSERMSIRMSIGS